LSEKRSSDSKEKMREFLDRQIARLRLKIADLQTQFKVSVSRGSEADEESGKLFPEASVLRLEYTQLCCERESLGPVWVSPDELRSFAPRESDSDQPTRRQPMGFRKNAAE
jgi:hypothetical protein